MTLATDQLTHVDPLDLVAAMLREPELKPYTERHLAGVRCHVTVNGRLYTGRGATQKEAAWNLLEAIARWQKEVASCE